MSKHTEGPWVTAKAGSGVMARVVSESAGYCVAQAYHDPTWNEKTHNELASEAEANACLVAAAPDLLEALEYLLSQTIDQDLNHGIALTEGEEEAWSKACAALRKARGGDAC